jgi:uncharacterized damage-inducible protein DinB
MMRRGVTFCLILLVVGAGGVRTSAADCGIAKAFQAHWEHLRDMLTAIVAAMPEDKYDYRPVPEVRSFREMAVHLIQDGITHSAWAAGISREESRKVSDKYANYKTRAQILQGLHDMFDKGHEYLGTITDQNMNDIVVGMRDEPMIAFEDQMDHYGNFVVYLRINGVVPPSTVNSAKERKENQEKLKEMGIQPPAEEHAH